MSDALFFYGPLCHAPLRAEVLGLGHSVAEARLTGYRLGRLPGSRQPAIVPGSGEVPGLLVDGIDEKTRARADFFAGVLGYVGTPVKARTGRLGGVAARAYLPAGDPPDLDGPWDLAAWSEALGPVWVAAAREAMTDAGRVSAAQMAGRWPTMCMRAATRLRAARDSGTEVRTDFTATRDIEIIKERRPYTEYFSLEDPDLRFRRFDGGWSNPVRRAAFIGGDAVTVLPYDPVLDSVLLVEQFRAGPLMRGDPRSWSLEPIAGRIDPGESPENTARREALEEAEIDLGPLHKVADYYPSPGAVTEFLFSFVAQADLAGQGGKLGGEAGEDEDIRTHVVPFETLMELIDSGEAGTGPLILSSYWLALNRVRLWG
ncbi:MAG TPA: tellurium resistance protein [Rhodobacteraceae bacterium]|nr:tellurium resistance protein [Paracoccaceae bacterium]